MPCIPEHLVPDELDVARVLPLDEARQVLLNDERASLAADRHWRR